MPNIKKPVIYLHYDRDSITDKILQSYDCYLKLKGNVDEEG